MRRAALAPLLCLSLCLGTACTQFPDLDGTITANAEQADYPALVPLETLQAPVVEEDGPNANPEAALAARSAALRARAARLRGAVVDDSTRTRMSQGVPQG